MRGASLIAMLLALGCGQEPTGEDLPVRAPSEEPTRLHVPPALLERTRREAQGLSRMPESLRRRALEEGRGREMPDYRALWAHAADHTEARVSFRGHVGLVRPAGRDLWIAALLTRREGERWVDPLYVLTVTDATALQGRVARIDGWVVGERAIGQHTLPLVIAFHAAEGP